MELPSHVRAIVDAAVDAAVVVGRDLELLYYNRRFLDLSGLRIRDLRARKLQAICHEFFRLQSCANEGCIARRAAAIKRSLRVDEVESLRDGKKFIITATPLADESGAVNFIVETYRDVTAEGRMQENYKRLLEREQARNRLLQDEVRRRTEELSMANSALQQALEQVSILALTDSLTGLHNRRYFDEQFDLEMNRVLRFKHHLSLVIFDLDRFKSINDVHGHSTGDVVLRRFGELARREVRSTDIVARLGGEEFGVLLLETEPKDALIAAERLRKAQEREGLLTTVSAGMASAPVHGLSTETIFAAADRALYAAKAKGRNNVQSAGTEPGN